MQSTSAENNHKTDNIISRYHYGIILDQNDYWKINTFYPVLAGFIINCQNNEQFSEESL